MKISISETKKCDINAMIFADEEKVSFGTVKLSYFKEPEILAACSPSDSRYMLHKLFADITACCLREEFVSLRIDLSSLPQEMLEDAVYSAGFACTLASYQFSFYKKEEDRRLRSVVLAVAESAELQRILRLGVLLGQETCRARDLINTRSFEMTPAALALEAKKLEDLSNVTVELISEDQMRENGMGGLLAVARGSEISPVLLVVRYKGCREHPERKIGIVGKGITYDSGGLSLKTTSSMADMHADMAGGAAALCALSAMAKTNLPINVTVVVPACENMLSPKSYRPGDIIRMMDGKTVEIKNVDAEGRLVLADAITWLVQREKVSVLLDIATLTSAAMAATGPLITPYVQNRFDDEVIQSAAGRSGQLVWRMPLLQDYEKYLKSEHADLCNVSKDEVVMLTGGMFLKLFSNDLPWVHFDIDGTSVAEPGSSLNSAGATGIGTALLYHLADVLAKEERKDER